MLHKTFVYPPDTLNPPVRSLSIGLTGDQHSHTLVAVNDYSKSQLFRCEAPPADISRFKGSVHLVQQTHERIEDLSILLTTQRSISSLPAGSVVVIALWRRFCCTYEQQTGSPDAH